MYVTRIFVIPKRFERLTHALEGRCSIQLSYGTNLVLCKVFLLCGCKDSVFLRLCQIYARFFKEKATCRALRAGGFCSFMAKLSDVRNKFFKLGYVNLLAA